jgi:hypothetical protein
MTEGYRQQQAVSLLITARWTNAHFTSPELEILKITALGSFALAFSLQNSRWYNIFWFYELFSFSISFLRLQPATSAPVFAGFLSGNGNCTFTASYPKRWDAQGLFFRVYSKATSGLYR